jgi:hypothetical protein
MRATDARAAFSTRSIAWRRHNPTRCDTILTDRPRGLVNNAADRSTQPDAADYFEIDVYTAKGLMKLHGPVESFKSPTTYLLRDKIEGRFRGRGPLAVTNGGHIGVVGV